MRRVLGAALFRLSKSRSTLIVIAAVVLSIVAVCVALGVDGADYVRDDQFEAYILEGKEVSASEYYTAMKEALEQSASEASDLDESQLHDLDMQLAQYDFFIRNNVGLRDFVDPALQYLFGAAYAMQVLYMVGIWICMAAAIALSVKFFPAANSGTPRTEFLTGGVSRDGIWTGKTVVAYLLSIVPAIAFSIAMFVCAICAGGEAFLVTDEMGESVYSVSVFAQWAAESAALIASSLCVASFANMIVCVSGDRTSGAVAACSLVAAFSFVPVLVTTVAPTTMSSYTSTLMPMIGLVSAFSVGASPLFGISVALYLVAAAILTLVAWLVFRRKAL